MVVLPPVSRQPAERDDIYTLRGPVALALYAFLGLALFAGFIALGTWQVHRRAWKLDLIARVDQRVHALPTLPPAPGQWPKVSAARDEYRHVTLRGRFLNDRQTLVWASTELGSGLWVITPLRSDSGVTVLVNRGFVLPQWCGRSGACAAGPAGEVTVTGLLRITETYAFLRHNEPSKNTWYTRDVQAIARAQKLRDVAPYFIDADAETDGSTGENSAPRGGLTVINFPNNHLVYLITWYLLALMVAAAMVYVGRQEITARRRRKNAARPLQRP